MAFFHLARARPAHTCNHMLLGLSLSRPAGCCQQPVPPGLRSTRLPLAQDSATPEQNKSGRPAGCRCSCLLLPRPLPCRYCRRWLLLPRPGLGGSSAAIAAAAAAAEQQLLLLLLLLLGPRPRAAAATCCYHYDCGSWPPGRLTGEPAARAWLATSAAITTTAAPGRLAA